jgi:hypothetical protein
MGKSKQQPKKSDFNEDQALKKKGNQQIERATRDLPSIVQRVSNDSTRQPGDILALQRTVGNRSVRRFLGKAHPKIVTPGAIQRHVSDETIGQFNSAQEQGGAAIKEAADGVTGTKAGISGVVGSINALMGAVSKAQAEPCGEEAEEGGG